MARRRTLDPGLILERARRLAGQDAGLLLETAGGLLSPWGKNLTAADVLATLGLPILLVASDVLGVQNHCLLTAEALERRGLRLAGLILVAAAVEGVWGNDLALAQLFPQSYLGRLPRVVPPTAAALAAALEKTDLTSVWTCFRT
jgi:dethiobiotin synthetase